MAMKPSDRHAWIAQYLRGTKWVDVLHQAFVDAYIQATGAPARTMPYGADKCAQLGRDLSAMEADGVLDRTRSSITGLAGQGFPKWVWSYRLAEVGGKAQLGVQ